MEEKLIHANGGIMINANVSVKNVMYVKKIMLEILLHVVVKMDNIKKVLQDDSAITYDRIIKLYDEKTKTIKKL